MKIAIENFRKITEFCTSKEIDVILFLASMQNQYGEVVGITYHQVCQEIDICRSYFYKTLYQLEEYGIIRISYLNEDYGTWKVTLQQNEFRSAADYKKGYFKVNRKVLFSDCFRNLNRTEKVILLKLLFMQEKKGHKFKIFMETLQRWTDKGIRTIRNAIENLCALKLIHVIFDFGNGYSFAAKEKELGGGKAWENENILRMKQLIRLVLRRNKAVAEEKSVEDTVSVLKACGDKLDEYIIQKLERCIMDCGSLQGAYINRLIRG